MRILLVSTNRILSPYPVYPLGLDYVAAAIEADHELRRVDLCGSDDDEILTRAIADFDPQVVGMSLRNIDNVEVGASEGFIDNLAQAVASVRACSPATIVLGGAGYTLFPLEVLHRVKGDYGVVGEGERFADLLHAIEHNQPIGKMPGVVTGTSPRKRGVDLAPGPYEGPCRRRTPEQLELYLKNGGMLNLQTKRGCPFKCFYCTYPLIEGRQLRRHDPQEVASEALDLERAGARYLFIADSVFNSDHQHAMEVARAMKGVGLSIPWGAYFAPLAAPDGFYEVMAQGGCSHVEFGTDTLSPRMLETYHKAFTVDHVRATHQSALAAGLHVAHFMLLGGPGEDEQSVDQTLDQAEQLEHSVCFFFCGIRIYPGTALWEQAVLEGQIVRDADDLLEPVFYRPQAIDDKAITARIEARAQGRHDWVVGSGGEQTTRILERMYARGRTGPLWEFLIR